LNDFVPAGGEAIPIGTLKSRIISFNPNFAERVPKGWLKFLRSNTVEWNIIEDPPESANWKIEQSDGAGGSSSEPVQQPSAELYATLLRQNGWRFAMAESLLAVYEIVADRSETWLDRQTTVDIVIDECEPGTDERDVTHTLIALAASGVTQFDETEDIKRYRVTPNIGDDVLLDQYDAALLSRLISGCDRKAVPFDPKVAQPLLLGAGDDKRIKRVVKLARKMNKQYLARRAASEG